MRAEAMPGEDPNKVILPEKITKEFVRLAKSDCNLNGELVSAQPSS